MSCSCVLLLVLLCWPPHNLLQGRTLLPAPLLTTH